MPSILVGSWALIPLAVTIISLAWRIVYNAFLHPLSSVPGPFLASVSGIPSWYHAMCGDRHIWLSKLFDTYGARIRIKPNTVIFRDPSAYKDIYNVKANVQKAPFYLAWQKDKEDINTFTISDKHAHSRRRKMLNQSFTEKSLRAAQPFIIEHVDRWNELMGAEDFLDDKWSEPINFARLFDLLVFDIMGDLCFGTSFNAKEPGLNPYKSIPHGIMEYMQFFYPLTCSPMLETILWLKPRGLDSIFKALTPPITKSYINFVKECVSERRKLYMSQKENTDSVEQRQDMFWFLCDAKKEDGSPAYSESELNAEANMLIIAGSDTTAVTLAAMIFYITYNPVQYGKLIHEIRHMFASVDETVHGPKLNACVYLRACIDETMRLSPSVLSDLPRQVLKGGATINGHYYPEGTIVGASSYADGHNGEFWGDAEVFRPERWIPSDEITQEDVNNLHTNLHPFAQGPGSCPGRNIAIMELCITLARTLYRFDVRQAPGEAGNVGMTIPGGICDKNVFQVQDAYVAVRNGPMVQLRKRHD